ERVAASKFDGTPGFGENRFGRLMLTDHGSEVWYRHFDLTELPTEAAPPSPTLASDAHQDDIPAGDIPGGARPSGFPSRGFPTGDFPAASDRPVPSIVHGCGAMAVCSPSSCE